MGMPYTPSAAANSTLSTSGGRRRRSPAGAAAAAAAAAKRAAGNGDNEYTRACSTFFGIRLCHGQDTDLPTDTHEKWKRRIICNLI